MNGESNIVEIITVLVSVAAVMVSLITAAGSAKQSAFTNLERYVERLEKRLMFVEQERDVLERRVNELEKERDQLNEKVARLEGEKIEWVKRNAELQEEIDVLRVRMDALKNGSEQK